jgi:peptidoglycan/LPS O-acetylase OafA/YrhL
MGTGRDDRLLQLDGLRGLAALSVFLTHYTLLDPQWGYPHGFLGIPRDGFAAVDLFFVLSGFVLTRSLLASAEGYVPFVIRRVFRLYPAYWAALIISALLFWVHTLTHPLPSNLPFWTQPITINQAIKHFFMISPGIDYHLIDPTVWSLVIEMRISLLMPLLVLGFVWCRSPWLRALILLLSPLLALIQGNARTTESIFAFLLGLTLAGYLPRIPQRYWMTPILLVAGIILYGNRELFDTGRIVFSHHLSAIGSALIILAAIRSPLFARSLTVAPIQFLGLVSYSFYLIHEPIIMITASTLLPLIQSPIACAAISLCVSLACSAGLYTWIEAPGIALGKRYARRYASHRPLFSLVVAPAPTSQG